MTLSVFSPPFGIIRPQLSFFPVLPTEELRMVLFRQGYGGPRRSALTGDLLEIGMGTCIPSEITKAFIPTLIL